MVQRKKDILPFYCRLNTSSNYMYTPLWQLTMVLPSMVISYARDDMCSHWIQSKTNALFLTVLSLFRTACQQGKAVKALDAADLLSRGTVFREKKPGISDSPR